jgi:hypothetical protein
MPVLRFKASDYPFDIFKLSIAKNKLILMTACDLNA